MTDWRPPCYCGHPHEVHNFMLDPKKKLTTEMNGCSVGWDPETWAVSADLDTACFCTSYQEAEPVPLWEVLQE